jgi:hypothetical protein
MRTRTATLGLLLALALAPALAGGWGQRQERHAPPPPPRQVYAPRPPPEPPRLPQQPGWQGHPMSSGQAAQRAQQINGGGRVLAVDPAQSGYRVRVLKDGEVRSVYVPPQ